jgi:hypothetical protein
MFWSDATLLAQFGTMKLWPIYLMLGNLSKYIRAKMDSGACHHVAYIPSVRRSKNPRSKHPQKFQLPDHFGDFAAAFHRKWDTQQKDILTHCRRELIHAVWNLLLDEAFIHAFKYGMVIKCADGVERRVYPRFFTYSADYPEKYVPC